jgi:hypothetical protein
MAASSTVQYFSTEYHNTIKAWEHINGKLFAVFKILFPKKISVELSKRDGTFYRHYLATNAVEKFKLRRKTKKIVKKVLRRR